jgi:valyl-tRNA synthetase
MHPYLSFITEEIYDKLPGCDGPLITSTFPTYQQEWVDEEASGLVASMQEAVKGIRALRADLGIAPDKKVRVTIKCDAGFAATDFFEQKKELLASFASCSSLVIDADGSADVASAVPFAGQGFEAFLFVKEAIDVEKELAKLEKEIKVAQKNLEGSVRKLSNKKFIANAKQEAIDKEKSKKAEFEEKIEKGQKHIEMLKAL